MVSNNLMVKSRDHIHLQIWISLSQKEIQLVKQDLPFTLTGLDALVVLHVMCSGIQGDLLELWKGLYFPGCSLQTFLQMSVMCAKFQSYANSPVNQDCW